MSVSEPPLPGLPLRVVLVEDRDDDALLIERAMTQTGLVPAIVRVETADAFARALDTHPELVLCDHALTGFNSGEALALLQRREMDIPFIVVSGAIDEESSVAVLRAGAHDFVRKQNLARLGPAIRRELQEARHRAERRHARQALRLQRDFLRQVIDANPGLIFVLDWQGRFVMANQAMADLCGTTVDDLVGRPGSDATSHRDVFVQRGRDVMTTGIPRFDPCEELVDGRTKQVRWFETRLVPLTAPTGAPQVLGIGTEITQRREAEDALRLSEAQFRQAQKMEAVGQLAGGIAHDFNNLLTAILGYSELILERVRDQPELASDVEEIRRAGHRAGSLTSQLLAFGRKQVLNPTIIDLNQVVTDVASILRRVIGEPIRLETVTADDLHPVYADPGQMEQVLMNLAINARDAMPDGGSLTIETANTPDHDVTLTVTDTGRGMPPDVRKRIFEPFFTTKGADKGTGLGLSMVYGVVTQSGGSISVQSAEGAGSCFSICLPSAPHASPTQGATPLPPADLSGGETLLLVEDEPAIRELVRKVLTAHGYRVLESMDTADAIRIAEGYAEPIHLMLSDIDMPHMSGPELAARLGPVRPRMRVLLMSGFGRHLSRDPQSIDPAIPVLRKPFTPDRLATMVREVLNRPSPAE